MTFTSCEREAEILEAARRGRWDEDLRDHLRGCAVCEDLSVVAAALQADAGRAAADGDVPGAGLIWWKAQLLNKKVAAAEAAKPIALFDRVAAGLVAPGLLGAVFWKRALLLDWLEPLSLAAGSVWSIGSTLPGPVLALGAAGTIAFLCVTLFALYAVWVEA